MSAWRAHRAGRASRARRRRAAEPPVAERRTTPGGRVSPRGPGRRTRRLRRSRRSRVLAPLAAFTLAAAGVAAVRPLQPLATALDAARPRSPTTAAATLPAGGPAVTSGGEAGAAPSAEGLHIVAPYRAAAGSVVEVRVVVGTGRAMQPVTLLAIGSAGTTALGSQADVDGLVRFSLSSAVTRAAGRLELVASSGSAVVRAVVQLEPGPIVDPVEPVVGARSIVADGADRSMAVVTPTDALGNGAPDGTTVDILRRGPGERSDAASTQVDTLVAWRILTAGTRAGRSEVHAEVRDGDGTVTGPSVSLDEVAGPPLPFGLTVEGPVPAADGHTLLGVRTTVLADAHGNVLADGTAVELLWDGPDGRSSAAGTTVAGVARFHLQAPTAAGRLVLSGRCQGTPTSGTVELAFPAASTSIPLGGRYANGEAIVEVGPVTGADGAFLPDGTDVVVHVGDGVGAGAERSAQLYDGRAVLAVPFAGARGPLSVRATILGTDAAATIP